MKAVFLFFALILCLNLATAQQVAINEDGSSADPSAILDIKATDKGVLFPRLTQSQRDAIPNPAAGLMVFQTNNNPGLRIFDGSSWELFFPSTFAVAFLKDVKPPASDGGASVAGQWTPRDLNRLEGNTSFVTLDAGTGRFTLEEGTYLIEAFVPAFNVNKHNARLYDVTSMTQIIMGSTEFSRSTSPSTTSSKIMGEVTVPDNTQLTFEIQHQTNLTIANGLGPADLTSFGLDADEVYTQVKITKIN